MLTHDSQVDSAESLHHVIIIKRVDSLQIHTTEFSHMPMMKMKRMMMKMKAVIYEKKSLSAFWAKYVKYNKCFCRL